MDDEWVPGATNLPVDRLESQPQLSQPNIKTAVPVDLAAASEQAAQIKLGFERLAQKYATLSSGRDEVQSARPTAAASTAAATAATMPAGHSATSTDLRALAAATDHMAGAGFPHGALANGRAAAGHVTAAIFPNVEPQSVGVRAESGCKSELSQEFHQTDSIPTKQFSPSHTNDHMHEQHGQHEYWQRLENQHGSYPSEKAQTIESARQAWSDSDRARRERCGSLGGTLAGLGGLSPRAEEDLEADAWRRRQQQAELRRALEAQMHEQKTRSSRSEDDGVGQAYRPLQRRVPDHQHDSGNQPYWQSESGPEPEHEPHPNAYRNQEEMGSTSPLNTQAAWQHGINTQVHKEKASAWCFDNERIGESHHGPPPRFQSHLDDFKKQPDRQFQPEPDADLRTEPEPEPEPEPTAADNVEVQLDTVERRLEGLLRASAEEKIGKQTTHALPATSFQAQYERFYGSNADTEEIEEVIASEEDQFSEGEWMPSPVKSTRIRGRAGPDSYSIEASLGGPPSSFISTARGVDAALSSPLSNGLGVDLGRNSVALESTSRFVDARAGFDGLFQEE